MRDFKPFLVILLSVLLLISTGLLSAVFYYFYYRTPVQQPVVKQVPGQKKIAAESTNDSLLKTYAATIRDLEKGFDSTWNNVDSLNTNLDAKLREFYKLRKEIMAVLEDRNLNTDLRMARQKINGLQERIAALRYTNMDVERENERLNALLNELKEKRKAPKQNISSDRAEKEIPVKNIAGADVFLLYELRFTAIQINDGKEQETNKKDLSEKLVGSFKVKNKNIKSNNAEIVFVVIQPDGKVLQNSAWDAGTFETPEGKKIYSGKLNFEYNRGEAKQLLFFLTADLFQQGSYTLKIYHNGILIGKMVKNLS